jgi:hypothetical protein
MEYFRKLGSEATKLSTVERIELIASCVGLAVDLVTILGFVGVLAMLPDSSEVSVGTDFLLLWIGFAILYSLGLLNSVLFRRYRRSRFARPYPKKRKSYGGSLSIMSDTDDEFKERLLLAAATSAPFLYAYIYALIGESTAFGSRAFSAVLYTIVIGLVIVPSIALAARAFDMILAAVSAPDS